MSNNDSIPANDLPATRGRVMEGAPGFTTPDGIRLQNLYTAGDAAPAPLPLTKAAIGAWDIRAEYGLDDPKAANEAILTDLERGVTSLHLHLGKATLDDLDRALDGVLLDLAPISIKGNPRLLMELWDRRGIAPENAIGAFNGNPLENLPENAVNYPKVTSVLIDTLPDHSSGAGDAQELAIAMATGVAGLRAMEQAGLSSDQMADQFLFRFAIDANFFQQIAKLRAARLLWAQILDAAGVETVSASMNIWAVTSPRIMTRRDPWVNILRGTGACFAAQSGGADSITVLPFTHALGAPDDFARRIARNIQVILQEESGLGHVGDPGAGSWAIEALTESLAEKAWDEFQAIEKDGGIAYWRSSGEAKKAIAAIREKREQVVATRKQAIIGVSEFPDLDEKPVVAKGEGAPGYRLAESFEVLRDASDAFLEKTGERPRIFLANLGKPSAHTPRAMFAKNLFEAGGIEAVAYDGTLDPDEMAAAWKKSGAELAVICGTDGHYADHLAAMAAVLKSAGVKRLYKAGKSDNDPADIDAQIYVGMNVIEELQQALRVTGALA